jgi:hypothetical protein
MIHSQIEPNNATVAPTNNIYAREPQAVQELQHIISHERIAQRERLSRLIGHGHDYRPQRQNGGRQRLDLMAHAFDGA